MKAIHEYPLTPAMPNQLILLPLGAEVLDVTTDNRRERLELSVLEDMNAPFNERRKFDVVSPGIKMDDLPRKYIGSVKLDDWNSAYYVFEVLQS